MNKKALTKVPVTERTLVQRINRTISKNDQTLRKARPDTRAAKECGTFYSVSTRTRGVVDSRIDIEAMGRELGVLKAFEQLAS